MRSSACIDGYHRACPRQVNRGTSDQPRLDGCSCSCHKQAKASQSPISGSARRWVKARDRYRCVAKIEGVCTGGADDVHHLLPRGRGGDEELDNLVTVCRACHDWIDLHPVEAKRLGLLA